MILNDFILLWFLVTGYFSKWTGADLNRRPPRCERGVLPTELPAHQIQHNYYLSTKLSDKAKNLEAIITLRRGKQWEVKNLNYW